MREGRQVNKVHMVHMQETYTAISIPVLDAMFLQPFRVSHIMTPAITMPPHVSLFGPFKDMETITQDDIQSLKDVFESFPRFHFTMRQTGRFSPIHVLYLDPEPATPFLALRRAIQAKFPELVPNFSDPVIHLTLARVNNGELDQVEAMFHREFGDRLPIEATVTEVGVYEKRDNAWHPRLSFALA